MSNEARGTPMVLVVDDDPMTRLLVVETLEPEGFRVAEATTGEEGLEVFARSRPDLVLLDVNMPGMDGFECCERMRRLPDGKRVPIVVFTGHDDDASITRAYEAGATDFTSKPMRWKLLGHRVRYVLRAGYALENLSDSEARFRSLVDLSSDWYWEQDEALRFTFLSEDGDSKSGSRAGAALGNRRWELPETTPLTGTWAEHRAVLEAREPFRDFEYVRTGDDGEPRYVSASGEPVFDSEGRFRGYRGVAKNITERKRAEQLVRLEHTVTRCLAEADSSAVGLEAVIRAICEAEGWECGRYFSLDESAGVMRFSAAWSVPGAAMERFIAGSRELAFAPGIGLVGRVWQSGEPLWVVDVGKEPGVSAKTLARDAGIHGALVFPVRSEGKTVGVLAINSKVREPDERLLQAMRAIGSQVGQFLQRRQAEGRLAYLAQYDGITGLPNRNLLRDRLDQAIQRARREAKQVAVLFADLDRFKLVNDTLGHQVGDQLLAEVGTRLRALVRASDTVSRFSGDEFVVVLPDLARAEDAGTVASKLLDGLTAPFSLGGRETVVNLSIGIALCPADSDDAESLLKAADAAMYRAKEAGRGRYCFFTAEMNRQSEARLQLQTELRRALERREFRLVYQPKVELPSRRVCGVEALLRWQHPERGMVSPAEFIPVLEETGLIVPVGEWVIEAACAQINAWRSAGLAPLPVAVNVSARQLELKDLDRQIVALIASSGVDPALLEIEITESYLMKDPEHAIRVLRNLREAGIGISIDDFGTGYSSLAYLTRLPVSALKVDRSFVRDATTDANAAAIVRTVVDLAHNLGFVVVAEGVETEEQVAFLADQGCDLAQGYRFGKPVPPDEIAALLAPPPPFERRLLKLVSPSAAAGARAVSAA
ncbi:MAG TPA: EAL domain-containing protein [Burkholderiales bacterium]|nr:EAL domain-containing protein [Burkholderiales bacterium]